jgi:hypothetical protein
LPQIPAKDLRGQAGTKNEPQIALITLIFYHEEKKRHEDYFNHGLARILADLFGTGRKYISICVYTYIVLQQSMFLGHCSLATEDAPLCCASTYAKATVDRPQGRPFDKLRAGRLTTTTKVDGL